MVGVVLSTSWVRHLGIKRASGFLPSALAERVTGSIWQSSMAKGWVDEGEREKRGTASSYDKYG